MGATNLTPNYELSQFIGTDKPAWLQDYNGDMLKIDTGIAGAKTAADNAQTAADGAQGDATSALSGVASINTELGTVNNTLNTATGNINTINSLIGNGTPTTTDQTIIGAINELHADIATKFVALELAHKISITADGIKTAAELHKDLADALITYAQSLADNIRIRVDRMSLYKGNHMVTVRGIFGNTSTAVNLVGYYVDVNAAGVTNIRHGRISTTAASNEEFYSSFAADGTYTHGDISTDVVASGTELSITLEVYEMIS